MSEKNRIFQYIGVIASVIIILSGISTYRPIVDYQLSLSCRTGDEVYVDYRDIEISALIKNRGGIDAPVVLEIKLENAFFSNQNPEWKYSETDTLLKITTTAPARQQDNWRFHFSIIPKEDKDNFNVQYLVKKRQSGDIIQTIFNILYKPRKWNPTYLAFERTSDTSFKRID